ncbi:Oxalate decarboxylase/archaeal phosphoglucose isomerase, cupin superfamily [Geosmithia morbida]|uniref:Oxalate decarboxylase/archaeal phosphoglucose isomerase, cupin superfamily n=1 Tax=Geosmithia morbida TaxID=1094350 RepID=A0A9P5D7Z0_9HYPO|nr:Oxalate decarboxylase/archaeal phosphoglucose isomerase, cupin superfamily [Geosmithia morbida]KAF4124999.1 Oxalate decarboxylase/archaeal phosphoglucose isomerase, cupin superfamily [Geosmithia morbida]
MRLQSSSTTLLLVGIGLTSALPHLDSPRQRLLNGLELPDRYLRSPKTRDEGTPYTPGHRDPYDEAVDPVTENLDPKPWRNGLGASVLGPWNPDRSRQDPDLVRPPSTDHGNIANMRWSFADSHIRIEEGGWTRQTTVRELPTSLELAAVNMRLDSGAIRELHWHKEAEWAYVLDGEVRVTALDYEGGNFIDDLKKGDLWYFPSGVPHSLQGLGDNGTEFLLVFDSGAFSEDSTFVLTDWLAHTPRSVIAKNFHLAPEVFDHLPAGEKYIFQGSQPGTVDEERPRGREARRSRYDFAHRLLDQEPRRTSGGEVRVADSANFPVSKTVAAAHAVIEPGALREMHWHPLADEWSFFISGRARVTVFAAEGTARTFNYGPGDVGIVPKNMGHFVENIGREPVEMLEVFRSDRFRDFSLFQWMGESPKRMVVDTMFAGDEENGDRFWEKVKDAHKDDITK